jgi:hypothetical protein
VFGTNAIVKDKRYVQYRFVCLTAFGTCQEGIVIMKLERVCMEESVASFEVLSRNLPAGAGVTTKNLSHSRPASRSRFEPDTFRTSHSPEADSLTKASL